jgi:hypothetical protein
VTAGLRLAPDTTAAPSCGSPADLDTFAAMYQERGFAVIGPPALDGPLFARLQREARYKRQYASWPLNLRNGRTTTPQDNMRGQLGPVARNWLSSEPTRALMRAVTGYDVAPSWAPSCFTYYDMPGSYLGRHCDQQELCKLALLVGLDSSWPPGEAPGSGNQLWVYPDNEAPDPTWRITTLTNRIVILNGSKFPHGRPPVKAPQRVSVLSACFMLAP